MTAAERADLAERMVGTAGELAVLVRDEDSAAIGAFLARLTSREKDALLVVQAAMIPADDAAPEELLSWVTWDEHGRTLEGAGPVLPQRAAPDEDAGEDAPRLPARMRRRLDFADLRSQGLPVARAAVRVGIDERTGWRYEQELRQAKECVRVA